MKIKNNDVSRVFRDEAFCEAFGWDLFTLYRQPSKRVEEFSILLDERSKKEKEEAEQAKREGKMRR